MPFSFFCCRKKPADSLVIKADRDALKDALPAAAVVGVIPEESTADPFEVVVAPGVPVARSPSSKDTGTAYVLHTPPQTERSVSFRSSAGKHLENGAAGNPHSPQSASWKSSAGRSLENTPEKTTPEGSSRGSFSSSLFPGPNPVSPEKSAATPRRLDFNSALGL